MSKERENLNLTKEQDIARERKQFTNLEPDPWPGEDAQREDETSSSAPEIR